MRNLLVRPKDPTPVDKQCGVIYHIECPECEQKYIGETSRPMGTRFKEHLKVEKPLEWTFGLSNFILI